MNFLAHAYLSFGHKEILAGNMISDFIKGKKKFDYPHRIRQGIELHREIDCYTDLHPAVASAREFFRPAYRLYSGAIVDIVLDYFLANDERIFTMDELRRFTSHIYVELEEQRQHLPPEFIRVFSYMKNDDWLFNYRLESGMQQSLRGIARRARYMIEGDTAFAIFLANKEPLRACFSEFFPAVKQFAEKKVDILLDH